MLLSKSIKLQLKVKNCEKIENKFQCPEIFYIPIFKKSKNYYKMGKVEIF